MLFLFSITWGSVSGWWTPVCLLLGLLYGWIMYRQPVSIGQRSRYALFALRAVAVFLIAFLLISPLVKTVTYQPQKPLVLVVQDNSSSIQTFKPKGLNPLGFVQKLAGLKKALGDEYEVREFNFDQALHTGLSGTFNGRQTNISTAVRELNERFVNQNIGALVLATDGLYNQGSDPQYEARNIKNSIYTIALGDTTPRRDLLVANVNYNKTALLGNDFMIEVFTEAYQSRGENMRLTVAEDGRQVHSQSLDINSNAYRKTIPVKLHAGKKGLHKFTISLAPLANELSTQNNTESIYIEVLDARQKILLVYASAHPDIRTIKQSIEHNQNFELKVVSADKLTGVKLNDYNLVILYQLSASAQPALKNFITKSKIPVWYIAGAQTDLQAFNAEQKLIQVAAGRTETQEVFGLPATNFSLFTLTDSTLQQMSQLPPLLAPYGNYSTGNGATVLLRQKIGNVATGNPLLAFGEADGRRMAVLAGEGVWRWQLSAYQTFGHHHALEDLFGQGVQYLTANANRQRFRVYTGKNIVDEGESLLLNAELYNDALELVNTPDVNINIKSAAGKNYSYLFSRKGQSYQLNAGALPAGDYTYAANTKLGNLSFTGTGQLTIKQLNLESRQSTANHQLLYALARQSGGQMLQPAQLNRLADMIRKNENIKTIVYDDKRYSDLIDVKWVFVLILALLSTEWFLRKREGEV